MFAVYKRNKNKGRWHLASKVINTLDLAREVSKQIKNKCDKEGHNNIEVIIQSFSSSSDIPESLKEAHDEKFLLN